MKRSLIALLFVSTPVVAADYVQGYMRRDGSYVQPHYRSSPDGNRFNNYSTQGNLNPYTGQTGTVSPYQYNPPSGIRYNNPVQPGYQLYGR